ncbi:DUF962 domain-containing protein [Sandaracinus amylolyticus]|uniref:Membrane protein n=1 Tax=Sandaracinus amylolyticus TaxID=927083 RepID=A0A0F6W0N1_9BACT|nr:Mpo1-like protein [Sandaracinus amylolyticus]AKF04227.1 membrane protein [Sandaracinus amylolyticus]
MRTLGDHLSSYASYHRDRRNIVTHFVGIPVIVLSVAALLARAAIDVGAVSISAATVVAIATCGFYVALDRRFGLVMSVLMSLAVWGGTAIAAQSFGVWLGVSLGLFVIGWAVQFVGHGFEGKKPAFVDDLIGLAVGPLFLVAEIAFALGLRDDVRREVERRAGPTRARTVAIAR